ncbi:MAG: tRNA (adenosine(37)-N6)-threonylcarbamoyltransferase complex transferase subunit TsaD [Candidatus Paceibacterota bacterium]|jgi:N6-L-threonylcarbamoyladenine synthase
MIILGIETSCDDTALSLIETRGVNETFECRVISSLVHSQADLHSPYGGVFPTLAKREHGKNIVPLFQKLLSSVAEVENTPIVTKRKLSDKEFDASVQSFQSEIQGQNPELFLSFSSADFLKDIPNIDRIAVTEGPGLEPALWVGINFARLLSKIWDIPLYPVNHMEGHVVGSLLDSDIALGVWQKLEPLPLPAIALLISGGHTELVKVDKIGKYKIIGKTKDDAVGEAFDKVARLLGLPYPGGPHISKLAKNGKPGGVAPLPRPMIHSGDLNFSFSGLKTAVLYAVRANSGLDNILSDPFKNDMALEFEMAVTDTLDAKLRMAIDETKAGCIIIGGGVSANERIRERLSVTAKEYNIPILMPSKHVSGDNALMIALASALDIDSNEPETKTPPSSLKAHGTKSFS